MNDPIADTVRGILDGHVVLSRTLADRGHHPAIDVLRSVSRVARDVSSPEHVKAASRLRELLAAQADAADLVQIGAYVAGSDPRVDAARALAGPIEALLRQSPDEVTPRLESIARLRAIAERSNRP